MPSECDDLLLTLLGEGEDALPLTQLGPLAAGFELELRQSGAEPVPELSIVAERCRRGREDLVEFVTERMLRQRLTAAAYRDGVPDAAFWVARCLDRRLADGDSLSADFLNLLVRRVAGLEDAVTRLTLALAERWHPHSQPRSAFVDIPSHGHVDA